MTEPVAGMSALRPRDAEVGGLPMPKAPAEPHLRNIKQRAPILVWLGTVIGAIGVWMLHPGLALTVASVLAAVASLFGFVLWRGRVFQRKNAAALELLNARKLDEAGAAFSELARGAPNKVMQAMAVYNAGVVAVRKGDLERALSLFASIWRAKAHTMMGAHQLREQVPLLISMLYTQLGDVDAGERWLAAARKLGKHPALAHMKNDILAEASLLARRGQYAAASALLATHWRAIEETLPASLMRNTRLMRAFVVERAGGPADEVEQLCGGCKPFEMGEYDSLGVGWPELYAFLSAHGFTSR